MLSKLTDAARAGVVTAFFTFLTTFLTGAAGWWQAVMDWVTTSGQAPFPDISVLGTAAVAAFLAALTGLANYLYRAAQSQGVLPGNGPTYPP